METDESGLPELTGYLRLAFQGEPVMLDVVERLAREGERAALAAVRAYRDGLSDTEILEQHGPPERLEQHLRRVHRLYVERVQARQEIDRPARNAAAMYGKLVQARRGFRSFLGDPTVPVSDERRARFKEVYDLVQKAIDYRDLPPRLGMTPAAVQELLLEFRDVFRAWAARRRPGAEPPRSNERG